MVDNKPGHGGLWPNQYKSEGDAKPTYTGHLFAHRDLRMGERIELAAWPHRTGNGMSLKGQDPRVPSAGQPPKTPSGRGPGAEAPLENALDDRVPF